MGPVTQAVAYQCTFDGCDWTAVRPVTDDIYTNGPPADGESLNEFIGRMVEEAVGRENAVVEAQIVHHLNSAHPGWTINQLRENLDRWQQRTRLRDGLGVLAALRAELQRVKLPRGAWQDGPANAGDVLQLHLDSIERYLLSMQASL